MQSFSTKRILLKLKSDIFDYLNDYLNDYLKDFLKDWVTFECQKAKLHYSNDSKTLKFSENCLVAMKVYNRLMVLNFRRSCELFTVDAQSWLIGVGKHKLTEWDWWTLHSSLISSMNPCSLRKTVLSFRSILILLHLMSFS